MNVELVVVWNGARDHYLDPTLNAPIKPQPFVGREIVVPIAPRPPSARLRLLGAVTASWQTVGQLAQTAQIPVVTAAQYSNVSGLLGTMYAHGQVERMKDTARVLGRQRYLYRKHSPVSAGLAAGE